MRCKIVLAKSFKRCIKDLKKHYPNVQKDIKEAIEEIELSPEVGDVIPGGHSCRKLRVVNSDSQRGKRGGYRLIYFLRILSRPNAQLTAHILFLYAKALRENITAKELSDLLDRMDDE